MTPRGPRGPLPLGERPQEMGERSSEELTSPRETALVLPEREPVEMNALARFSRDTALTPRLSSSLRMFQNLPQARLVVRDSRESFNLLSILRRWYQEWRGQPLAGNPINLLLDAGTDSRVRTNGDVTTLHFPAEKGVIQIVLEGSSGLTFWHDSNSWLGNRYMFREANQVFLRHREGGESSTTWLWNRNTGAWILASPGQPLLLKKGMVLAFGPAPSLHEIFNIPQRAQEMKEVLVSVEGSLSIDSIHLRRIRGKSLHYFLSGIVRESDLVLQSSSSDFFVLMHETDVLGNEYNLNRVVLRLNAAKYQDSVGQPREALLALEIAESELHQKLMDIGCQRHAEDAHWFPGKKPKDVELQLNMVELYELRAEILERLQEPEAAAEAYSSGVEYTRNILSSVTDPATKSMREWAKTSEPYSIRLALQWASYRAHRLFYQKAERTRDEGNLGAAALAYETAAKFVTEAMALQNSSSSFRNYANHPVISEEVLLRKAWEGYRQAGMREEAARVRAELFSPRAK